MAQFKTTELDFDQIKENLKTYFKRTDSAYKDWDFEGSSLDNLLDVLAYNTHYNAVNAHMAMNESFLDSAQLRSNVVSRAKLLGYTPKSRTASAATLELILPRKSGSVQDQYTLNEGTQFSATLDGTEYLFQTVEDVTATYNNGQNGYYFSSTTADNNPIKVFQGRRKKLTFSVDSEESQRFVIPDRNVDTSQIKINVFNTFDSTVSTAYNMFTEFSSVDSNSAVYFLTENSDGLFQITFGEGTIGKKLNPFNKIEVDYIDTDGAVANGIQVFNFLGSTNDNSPITGASTVRTVIKAQGGADKETIQSIKYNAPLAFIAQNRAVTSEDYRGIITKKFSTVRDVSVWGGEENSTPDFGKVYISCRPTDTSQTTLTDPQKGEILDFMEQKKVLSIKPKLVDPVYTYLYFTVFFKYNTTLTSLTQNGLGSKVRDTINTFRQNSLENFDGIFRFTQFTKIIDDTDMAILNNTIRTYAYKNLLIRVVNGQYSNDSIDFGFAIAGTTDQNDPMIESSGWQWNGETVYLGDETVVSEPDQRNVFLYTLNVDGSKRKVMTNVGKLYPATGKLSLNNLPATDNTKIQISTKPASDDVLAKHNEILTIDMSRLSISPDIDPVSSGTSSLLSTYTTFPRESTSFGSSGKTLTGTEALGTGITDSAGIPASGIGTSRISTASVGSTQTSGSTGTNTDSSGGNSSGGTSSSQTY